MFWDPAEFCPMSKPAVDILLERGVWKDFEKDCLRKVDDMIEADAKKGDFREAAMIIAYHQPEKIAELIQGWMTQDPDS